MTLDDFRDLWESPTSRYVLVRVDGGPDVQAMIYDPSRKMVELIDDDDLHEKVVERMISAGFPLVDRLPDSQD